MQFYSDIFEGASAQHLGAACVIGKGALLLESTIHAAPEYIESLRPCRDESPMGNLATEIHDFLCQRGYVRNGFVHPHGAEHMLLSALNRSGAEMLFLSQVLSVVKQTEGYLIRVLALNTVEEYRCYRFHPAKISPLRCCNALAVLSQDFSAPQGVQVFSTIYPALHILQLSLYEGVSWEDTRRLVQSISGARLVHIPSMFCQYAPDDPGFFGALHAGEKGGANP